MGQGSSPLLSDALDQATRAFDYTGDGDLVDDPFEGPLNASGFYRLNTRHMLHLVTQKLQENLSVLPGPRIATLMDGNDTVITLDAVPPTDTKIWEAIWENQYRKVLAKSHHREDRLAEIFLQQSDLLSFYGSLYAIGPQSHPWTHLLLEAVLDVTFRLTTEFKAHLFVKRPYEYGPGVHPVIQTPSHSSFPSGHATEAFCLAGILSALFGRRTHARLIAVRIAKNREFAGVHYPMDSHAGAVLGDFIAARLLGKMFEDSVKTKNETFAIRAPDAKFGAGVMEYASKNVAKTSLKPSTETGALRMLVDLVQKEIQ